MTWGEQNTEAEGHQQLDAALASGVNFIDTAEMYSVPPRPETYGSTERVIGTWFNRRGKLHWERLPTGKSGNGKTRRRHDGPAASPRVGCAGPEPARRLVLFPAFSAKFAAI